MTDPTPLSPVTAEDPSVTPERMPSQTPQPPGDRSPGPSEGGSSSPPKIGSSPAPAADRAGSAPSSPEAPGDVTPLLAAGPFARLMSFGDQSPTCGPDGCAPDEPRVSQ
jgi:hypothetical protein